MMLITNKKFINCLFLAKTMLRAGIIGPGNIKFHYFDLLKITEEKFNKQVEDIAKALQKANVEIVILPDRGVSFEVAKKYKEFGGKKVYGTVPLSDKDFGVTHLEQYINAKVNGKRVIDEIIDTQNWYKENLTHCLYGDVILMLGNSLGSLGELCFGYYLHKLFVGAKPEVKARKEKIHKEIKAGERVTFSVIVYKPFFKDRLNEEIEKYIRKVNGEIYYVNSPTELERILKKISSSAIKRNES